MSEKVIYYYSSVSSNLELKKHQQKMEMILDSKRIDYEKKDIAGNDENKNKMREIMDNPQGLPPQLTKGNVHLGGFDEFEAAVENDELNRFLQLS